MGKGLLLRSAEGQRANPVHPVNPVRELFYPSPPIPLILSKNSPPHPVYFSKTRTLRLTSTHFSPKFKTNPNSIPVAVR